MDIVAATSHYKSLQVTTSQVTTSHKSLQVTSHYKSQVTSHYKSSHYKYNDSREL